MWAAVERIHDDLGLSARHITVSTVGIVPGIRKLAAAAAAGEPGRLAARRQRRAARRARADQPPLPARRRCSTPAPSTSRPHGRRLSFEWALIDGVNDRASDADELAALCRRLPPAAHVNLIPLNPTPGLADHRLAAGAGARVPRRGCVALGVNATVRRNRGTDIDAACGQLAARHRTESSVTRCGSVEPTLSSRRGARSPSG